MSECIKYKRYKSIKQICSLAQNHQNPSDILDLRYPELVNLFRHIFQSNDELHLIDPSNKTDYERCRKSFNKKRAQLKAEQQNQQHQQQNQQHQQHQQLDHIDLAIMDYANDNDKENKENLLSFGY